MQHLYTFNDGSQPTNKHQGKGRRRRRGCECSTLVLLVTSNLCSWVEPHSLDWKAKHVVARVDAVYTERKTTQVQIVIRVVQEHESGAGECGLWVSLDLIGALNFFKMSFIFRLLSLGPFFVVCNTA